MNTNSNPIISVILPTYNRGNVISRAIESVLCQTYKNIELIIIDDGSFDNTEEVISKYKDDIKYIKQDNAGASSARNNGIRQSQGEYIAFLDSDDQWECNKLQLQYEFFASNDVALVSTDSKTYFEDGSLKKISTRKLVNKSIKSFEDVFMHPYLGTPTVMVKKSVILDEGGFDETLRTAEDIDLFLRISSHNKIGYINKKLVNIYLSSDGLSTGLDSYEDNIKVLNKTLDNNSSYFNDKRNVVNEVMSKLYVSYSRELLWNGNPEEARKQLIKSMKYKLSIECFILLLKTFLKR